MRVLWQCESDEFCRRVLARHWPGVPCYGDVATLTGPPRVDVLCGGFPCQDISQARADSNPLGLDGARSGLWSEFARLAGELRPRYVLVENVPALLGRGLGRVLGDLAAIGYDAEWDCIPASAFGAPHQRDRIWIVGYPDRNRESAQPVDDEASRLQAVGDSNSMARSPAESRAGRPEALARSEPLKRTVGSDRGPNVAYANGEPVGRAAITWPQCDHWSVEPGVGRVADGVPDRMDRLKALGNALVPQIAEWIGRRIVTWEDSC
jgi:DNA (cytosine-5)-methyltransferase 1